MEMTARDERGFGEISDMCDLVTITAAKRRRGGLTEIENIAVIQLKTRPRLVRWADPPRT